MIISSPARPGRGSAGARDNEARDTWHVTRDTWHRHSSSSSRAVAAVMMLTMAGLRSSCEQTMVVDIYKIYNMLSFAYVDSLEHY